MRIINLAVGSALALSLVAWAQQRLDWPTQTICKKCIVPSSAAERLEYVKNASALDPRQTVNQSWFPTPPKLKKDKGLKFAYNEEVHCTFKEPDPQDPPNGKTPKFYCDLMVEGEVKDVKVKHHTQEERNDGIWGEILTTRLFKKLGFPADNIFPVRVVCENCPSRPWEYYKTFLNRHFGKTRGCDLSKAPAPLAEAEVRKLTSKQRECYEQASLLFEKRERRVFTDAVIEEKYAARPIEMEPDQGWSWTEFDEITRDPAKLKVLQPGRDALALAVAFVQHVDNKAEQQRLICFEDDGKRTPNDKVSPQAKCLSTGLMAQDVGFSFGFGHIDVADDAPAAERHRARAEGTASLKGFLAAPVWSDKEKCVTHVQYYKFTGTPADKKISEAGRKLLADRLKALTDKDLNDIFDQANIENRGETITENGQTRPVHPSDWIAGFKQKIKQITEHPGCPQS